jgi:hypothetical protein
MKSDMPKASYRELFQGDISEIEELLEKASQIVNPASGIANDYLNQYNEILLLVENLPILMPEMVEELLAWKPKTYIHYFETSPLPHGDTTIKIYKRLNPKFRESFEAHSEVINQHANGIIAVIESRRDENNEIVWEHLDDYCAKMSSILRAEIEKANHFVNHGMDLPPETPQQMADRLMQQAPGGI